MFDRNYRRKHNMRDFKTLTPSGMHVSGQWLPLLTFFFFDCHFDDHIYCLFKKLKQKELERK